MAKTSKKKSYTEDVVLNNILKEISEEKLKDSNSSNQKNTKNTTYEDDLIKYYRTKDAVKKRQKYINIIKIITLLLMLIILIGIFIYYFNNHSNKKMLKKKTVTPTPLHQPKVEQVSLPIEHETVRIKPKKKIELQTEPKIIISEPIKEAVKKVKNERELAKERLLQQMNN